MNEMCCVPKNDGFLVIQSDFDKSNLLKTEPNDIQNFWIFYRYNIFGTEKSGPKFNPKEYNLYGSKSLNGSVFNQEFQIICIKMTNPQLFKHRLKKQT